jgi:gliding motility-associated-like protein
MNYLLLLLAFFQMPTQTQTNDCEVVVSTLSLKNACPTTDSEVFKIKTDCELNYSKIMVFNRWGNIVFKELNTNQGFDGTYQNANLPEGAYFYYVAYQIKNEPDTISLQGYLDIYE